MRHRQFFCLTELNTAIAELLIRLNERPFKKLRGSRRELFKQLDRPALAPLPDRPPLRAMMLKPRADLTRDGASEKVIMPLRRALALTPILWPE